MYFTMPELNEIKEAVSTLKTRYPNYKVYITVNPDLDKAIVEHLSTEDYSIKLKSLFDTEYRVSPFMEGVKYIVSLFDYSQILGQWNTYNDVKFGVKELMDAEIKYLDSNE